VPRELAARPAITIRVAVVEFSRHRDEAQIAEAIIIELDKAGLDQINGLLSGPERCPAKAGSGSVCWTSTGRSPS
jgi:hypothetical protein